LTYEHRGVARGDLMRGHVAAQNPFLLARAFPVEIVASARERGIDQDAGVRSLIVGVFLDSAIERMLEARLGMAMREGSLPEQAGSILKLFRTSRAQRSAEVSLAIAGPISTAWRESDSEFGRWAHPFLRSRSLSISAGTNEIHRNILGEHVLGLPHEPKDDRGLPFRATPKNSLPAGRGGPR
jgi:alkylation response protein AidB-like acyl-CoA dehydrogenase